MNFRERVIEILAQRASEIYDGATKLEVIDSADFEQIAMDLEELLRSEYSFEAPTDES